MNSVNARRTRHGSRGCRLGPGVERLERRTLLTYPALVLPSYVYGSANLGGNVQSKNALLSKPGTENGDIVDERDNGPSSLDEADTDLIFDDNNSGNSTTTSIDLKTFADNADGIYSGASAIGYTTDTPNQSPPGQDLIPVRINPSDDSDIGQAVTVTLKANYQNTNIIETTGSNSYAVQYQVGSTVYTLLKAVDTQLPPGGSVLTQSATFTATVGDTFDVYLYSASTTGDGAPGADVSLDVTAVNNDDGSGGTGGGGTGGGGTGGGGTGGATGGAAPEASNYQFGVPSGQVLQINAPGLLTGDVDPAGLPLSVVGFANPSHGTVTVSGNGAFVYTPTVGYTGSDSFTYTVGDSVGLTATGIVSISVVAPVVSPAGPPVAANSFYETTSGQVLQTTAPGVLTTDSDPAGLPLSVVGFTNPANGTVTVSGDGAFVYTPAAGFTGGDSFAYTVANSAGLTASATVTILVLAASSVTPILTPVITPVITAPATVIPYVVSVAKVHSHGATTGLVVTYSAGDGLENAATPSAYVVTTVVKHGKGKGQRIRSVSFNAVSDVATIALTRKISGSPKLQLSINGVLATGTYTTTF